jgi:hypothetical protein
VHYLSFTAWIGGALAAMAAGMTMRRLDRSLWGGVAEAQGAIYRSMVGPGAMVSVASGLMLTFGMYGKLSAQVGAWLGMMQAVGIVAALVTLLGAMPAAARLSRLEPHGPSAAAFDATRRKLAITASLGGTLALIALLAGALYRG